MRITVSRSFTYDLDDIKQQWLEIHGVAISDDDAIEYVEELAHEDHGTPCKVRELVFINSDTGMEITECVSCFNTEIHFDGLCEDCWNSYSEGGN